MNTEHALLSASGAIRWMTCPASVRAEAQLPETPPSKYATEGGVAHALAELCLIKDKHADAFIGSTMKDYPDHRINAATADAVQLYLDFVRNLPGERVIEQRVDYSPWAPGGFGTADTLVMQEETLHVVDLKFGQGVRVDAAHNAQLMLYALGALHTYSCIYHFDHFHLVIVQPRLDHISEWDITRTDLLKWAHKTKKKAALALREDAPFNPGDVQCRFCEAKATCQALAKHCLETVTDGFEAVAAPITLKDSALLSSDEIAAVLLKQDMIKKWLTAVAAYAQAELEKGHEIPGYKLVEGRSNREWKNEADAEKALRASALKVAEIFPKKLITPAQAEKVLGKEHPIFQDHVNKPKGKPTIVPLNDKRPALAVEAPTAGFSSIN